MCNIVIKKRNFSKIDLCKIEYSVLYGKIMLYDNTKVYHTHVNACLFLYSSCLLSSFLNNRERNLNKKLR